MAENKQNPGPRPMRRGEGAGDYENRERDHAGDRHEHASEGGHAPGKFRDDSQRSPEAGRKVGGGREDG